MKKLFIVFLGVILAKTTLANVQIEWNSDTLPTEIRQRIQQTVTARCEVYGKGLKESRSVVRVDRIDQGVIDYYYSVRLSTSQRIDQMMFEDVDAIQVDVVHYSFSNPLAGDPIQIESVKGISGAGSCK